MTSTAQELHPAPTLEPGRTILELHGLAPTALGNSTDLPYGIAEREDWLRNGGSAR